MFELPMPVMKMAMARLQNINPQGFQFVDQAMRNGGNPIGIWKQISGKMNPNQIQGILNNVGQYGCPQSVIKQFQNINDTKPSSSENKPK